jgi:hypothetical protein
MFVGLDRFLGMGQTPGCRRQQRQPHTLPNPHTLLKVLPHWKRPTVRKPEYAKDTVSHKTGASLWDLKICGKVLISRIFSDPSNTPRVRGVMTTVNPGRRLVRPCCATC